MLDAFRHLPPVDRAALEGVLLRVSEMACEIPELYELDINPLLADERRVLALDARVVLRPASPRPDRYGHLSITPYPADLVTTEVLRDGRSLLVRPIRPEDADLESAFVSALGSESRRQRFRSSLRSLSPEMLARFTQIDYDREMALVAIDGAGGAEREVAVCRYVRLPDERTCEFAIVVADAWRGSGLGRRLLERLAVIARAHGLAEMVAWALAGNAPMVGLARSMGFRITAEADDPHERRLSLRLDRGSGGPGA